MKKTKATSNEKSEFKRFEEFTHRLIAVPKKEIEKKKAEYERKKAAAKPR